MNSEITGKIIVVGDNIDTDQIYPGCFNGYLDLITLWFLSSFGRKPMHVFG